MRLGRLCQGIRKTGVCLVTSGPGATNTVTGIATAYMDSVPLVIFSGQVQRMLIGNDAFQEADIVGITRPCTKHNYLVKDVKDLAEDHQRGLLHSAIGQARARACRYPQGCISGTGRIQVSGKGAYPGLPTHLRRPSGPDKEGHEADRCVKEARSLYRRRHHIVRMHQPS